MADLFNEVPVEMNRWKTEAEQRSFFGISLSELSRDELLAVVGALHENNEAKQKAREEHECFLRSIAECQQNT